MASIQLSIADPCHENWDDMLPEEKGRFCLSCQKTVVDFTQMSDRQIFDYFKNYKGNTCGQFSPAQLDREIVKPRTYSMGGWKYFWQILLPAVFAFHKAEAQTLKGKVAPKAVCKTDTVKPASIIMGMIAAPSTPQVPKYELEGTVLNEKQEPVPYASVVSETGKTAVADSSGRFLIEMVPGKSLIISSIGYETKVFSYDSIKPDAIKNIEVSKNTNTILINVSVQLEPVPAKLQDVIIEGYGVVGKMTIVSGGVSKIYTTSLFQKVSNPVKELPQFTISPNPIQKGQNFQVNLQTKKKGNYLLKIIDASGKTIVEEKLNITSNNQTETISGSALQQAGIYFIHISNPADKKDKGLTGKIAVQ